MHPTEPHLVADQQQEDSLHEVDGRLQAQQGPWGPAQPRLQGPELRWDPPRGLQGLKLPQGVGWGGTEDDDAISACLRRD